MAPAQFDERRWPISPSWFGITFTVYSDGFAPNGCFFDLVPRILPRAGDRSSGPTQRVFALNLFYRTCPADPEGSQGAAVARPRAGTTAGDDRHRRPRGIYTHIAGIDLVRDPRPANSRPRGQLPPPTACRMLENRPSTRIFPRAFQRRKCCRSITARRAVPGPARHRTARGRPGRRHPDAGVHNSAYEHSLAQMGVELVESRTSSPTMMWCT
jgi:uncharacterized circularly permuted ATP-grasp superfamily protein